MTKVLVLGASGTGTSTLGAALASALGWRWLDLDDYYWEPTDPPFTTKRDRATRLALVTRELTRAGDAVVSGSPLSWGSAIENAFDVIVFVTLDTATRLQRLRTREVQRSGFINETFLAWAARYDDDTFDGRSRRAHESWFAGRPNVVRIDGARETDAQVAELRHVLAVRKHAMRDVEPTDAFTAIIERFANVPIVAIDEMHGIEQGARFIEALVQHPDFARVANAIVVEFGNSLFQDVIDRYVAGCDVDPRTLRRVWEDFAGAAPWGFRQPIYPQFFATVRAVNQALPSDRRIRVLLGDPPLDWQAVRTLADVDAARGVRDPHFADVIAREVLARGHRALILAGAFHLVREPPFGPPRVPAGGPLLAQLLDSDHPGKTYVVLTHHLDALDERLASWPIPSFAEVHGTWLGALPAEVVFGGVNVKLETSGGVITTPYAGSPCTLQDLVDGYLYLGPTTEYTQSHFDSEMLDADDRAELDRRIAVCTQPNSPRS